MTKTLEAPADYPLWIGGQKKKSSSGKTFPVKNPANGETIAQVAEGGAADVDAAFQAAAKAALGPWGRL
jgi:acyl-CoA reductase-like NAD-dependent aldehyde dehydrogenase